MILNYFLLFFCVLSLIFSFFIIISKNPIHSILYLILVFCCVTFILIALGVEFIAITFLIVYVGAIAVLFLFVVMMLNIKILELDETFWKYAPIGLLISSVLIFQIFSIVFGFEDFSIFFSDSLHSVKKLKFLSFSNLPVKDFIAVSSGEVYPQVDKFVFDTLYGDVTYSLLKPSSIAFLDSLAFSQELSNTEMLGWIIYTYTFFTFLILSLILLLSMIGSIVLVLNQNINVKRQFIFKQTLRELKDSVILKN